MKLRCFLIAAAALVAWTGVPAKSAPDVPTYIASAVADAGRPADDKAQDANRKPEDVLAFAGVKPGDKVVDLMPGSGYYTRIFSKIVVAQG